MSRKLARKTYGALEGSLVGAGVAMGAGVTGAFVHGEVVLKDKEGNGARNFARMEEIYSERAGDIDANNSGAGRSRATGGKR